MPCQNHGSFLSIILILKLRSSFSQQSIVDDYVYLNCNNLEDTFYDIQIDDSNLINVKCSNGYMIIDVSHDSSWYNLLSSHKPYHEHIIGPELNDHVNWDDFIPSLDIDHYLVSPDCSSCDAAYELNSDLYEDKSAYYMNQIANGCFHKNRGLPACDMDPVTYECKLCEWTEGTVLSRPYESASDYLDDENTGICGFTVRPHDFVVATDFSECFNYQYTAFKPSLGTDGRFCQCIKSDADNVQIPRSQISTDTDHEDEESVDISPEDGDESSQFTEMKEMTESNAISHIVYLYQSDFDEGTYRIQRGGTYHIMEDIEFDFNANIDEPNARGSYMPRPEQSDLYPGTHSIDMLYF